MTILTRRELCERLGISEKTFRRNLARSIPALDLGGRSKRYLLEEVLEHLRSDWAVTATPPRKRARTLAQTLARPAEHILRALERPMKSARGHS